MYVMEKEGNPKIILETLLDFVGNNQSRKKYSSSGPYLDGDRENGHDEFSIRPALGTAEFENDGSNAIAEEFKSPWTHFDGLGYNNTIPPFLRFHGKVQNIYFSKKDIIRIIQEIWEAKTAYDIHIANIAASNIDSAHNATDILHTSSNNQAEDLLATATTDGDTSSVARRSGSNAFLDDRKQSSQQATRRLSFAPNNTPFTNASKGNAAVDPSLPLSLLSQSLIESLPVNPSLSTFVEHYLLVS
jgi:hypothetical protein